MTTPTPEASPYGNASDWASILSGVGAGASAGVQGAAGLVTSKKEAKEAKRRTLANLFKNNMMRSQALSGMGQEHEDDLRNYQAQAIQQVARGFIESLQGSTG
jgi:hypothetical protein